MISTRLRLATPILCVSALLSVCGTASAGMVLTAAGTAQGFGLSTFATGFPSNSGNSIGPLGLAVTSSGVLIGDWANGTVYRFASDVDGQTAAGATATISYGGQGSVHGMGQLGDTVYMNSQSNGTLLQLNPDGTFNQTIVGGFSDANGVVVNPVTGHVYIANSNGIYDVNPITKTKTLFVSQTGQDGLTISADGSILYAEVNGHIIGYNTSTAAKVFDSGFISGGPDGTVIGQGPLLGNIFVNTNNGNLIEVNLTTLTETIIGTGGTRGDFVTVDTTNGSLLVTQTSTVLRLTPPAGGFTSPVPEPSTILPGIMSAFAIGLACWRRQRRKAPNGTLA